MGGASSTAAFLAGRNGGGGISYYTPARGGLNGNPTTRGKTYQLHCENITGPPNPAFGFQQQVRGKKTKSSVRFEDLPQGPIIVVEPTTKTTKTTGATSSSSSSSSPGTVIPEPGREGESVEKGEDEDVDEDVDEDEDEKGPAYPTVVLQARRNMRKFDNCVLLTRVGGFYELYFEHAEEYGPLLNLKVAQKKTNAGPVPMVGGFIFIFIFSSASCAFISLFTKNLATLTAVVLRLSLPPFSFA